MWRFVLALTLLCWESDGAVTCKDENNAEVNWYILYKAPRLNTKRSGLEYVYIDSNGARTMKPSTANYKSIKHPDGVLANTLRPLLAPIRNMQSTFGFMSYSDQPPGCMATDKFGHSKGVLLMDETSTGVWLMHSTPQFPFRRDQNNFWPPSGARNAQTFICVTFQYSEFKKIGLHLQSIGAFPFEHDIPLDFHQELRDAANWVQSTPPSTPIPFTELISTDLTQKFYSIYKKKSPQLQDGDLYFSIAQALNSDLNVQTWGCQRDREGSSCVSGFREVLNVNSIRTDLGDWKPKCDHSKWCVAKDPTIHVTCIADVNRAPTQYQRLGGALCFHNIRVKQFFQQFVHGTEACSTPNIMDMSDCEPEPDTDSILMG